jgi:hypothetical protein
LGGARDVYLAAFKQPLERPAFAPRLPAPTKDRKPVGEERGPFGVELGVSGVVAGWTGGQVLLGGDGSGRVRLGRWVIVEARLGARRVRAVELANGSIEGSGVSGGVGLALDPFGTRQAGISFGARLAGAWLRYVVTDRRGVRYGRAQAGAVSLAGTTTAFMSLSEPLCVTLDLALGGALRSVTVRDQERRAPGLHGVVVASAAGLAARF